MMPFSTYKQWSDSVIWLFLGGFFLAEAMKKTKTRPFIIKSCLTKIWQQPGVCTLGIDVSYSYH
ncbi:sodium:sulfate symporter transmembrane region, partial [Pasteurella multocida subsp. multocida str. Anand1_cattle]